MHSWQNYCKTPVADFIFDNWETWPDAGIGIAHGECVMLDIDTDDRDTQEKIKAALPPSPAIRKGRKGYGAYYRNHPELEQFGARVRWYKKSDESKSPAIELLLTGTQSVIPPSIHPDTQKPYQWLSEEGLDALTPDDLEQLPPNTIEIIDAALGPEFTRKVPRKDAEFNFESNGAHDLEKPWGRSVNDRALEPDAIDLWWPALGLAKSRQRGGSGMWEGVAQWRSSNSGRPLSERNPNLKIAPGVNGGIMDYGADQSYTPIDLVMAAQNIDVNGAVKWLGQFIRDEDGTVTVDIQPPEPTPEIDTSAYIATPAIKTQKREIKAPQISLPNAATFDAEMPMEVPEYPIDNHAQAMSGLLGEVIEYIEDAAAAWTDTGAVAVALPTLGALIGQDYATPSDLRANLYTVLLGGSGRGKTAMVKPAQELLTAASAPDIVGESRIASGSGLLKALGRGSRRVHYLDEFGHMLQQVGAPGAGSHAKQIITEFTALFSASNTIHKGTAYATQDPVEIAYPHLCLFGMATPDQFWRAFGSSSLEDGTIARYLVFPAKDFAQQDPDTSERDRIARKISDLYNANGTRLPNAPPQKVALSADADAMRVALRAKCDAFGQYADDNSLPGAGAILRRVTEMALKIALIHAVGRSPKAPIIEAKDFEIAHVIAWWNAQNLSASVRIHIADNEFGRQLNKAEDFIRTRRSVSWRELSRKMRPLKSREIEDIVASLTDQGIVDLHRVVKENGGHPQKIIKII